jgi:hypothetical protein
MNFYKLLTFTGECLLALLALCTFAFSLIASFFYFPAMYKDINRGNWKQLIKNLVMFLVFSAVWIGILLGASYLVLIAKKWSL